MPYFECAGCGQIADVERLDAAALRQHCPVCESRTTWRIAFESDAGVSF